VDDHPDVVDRYGGHAIAAFDGDSEDRELWKLAERLDE
jgi:hypothetical protein